MPWQEDSFPGLLSNVVAGRIANRLDLHGTNCTVDAACASSLAAVSAAVNELALGKADLVVTGGVDVTNNPLMYVCFSKTPALSPTGDARPFSEDADGTLLGEGLAMLGLRRLDAAERDGDRIYAVIRGLGTSSDGRGGAIYAPMAAGQVRALRRAYETAGYGPDTVELVEAHGTATRAGDAAEFKSLRQVFGETGRPDSGWCALGTVKSQIGHTKSAAGAAGLIKAVLALHQRVLPPTIKVRKPNPGLGIESSPFYLNTAVRPWTRRADHPRRASVSSFGFGGANYHVALEEYGGADASQERSAARVRAHASELVLVSGDSPGDLRATPPRRWRPRTLGPQPWPNWRSNRSAISTRASRVGWRWSPPMRTICARSSTGPPRWLVGSPTRRSPFPVASATTADPPTRAGSRLSSPGRGRSTSGWAATSPWPSRRRSTSGTSRQASMRAGGLSATSCSRRLSSRMSSAQRRNVG